MSEGNVILWEVDDDGVATVTLNRPERMNSLTDPMVSALYDTMQAVAADDRVRVILLTGAGRAFCAGADVGGMLKQTPRQIINKLRRPFDHNEPADYQTRHTYLPAIPKPVIAVINGPAVGLGLVYALSCDVRFCADDAVLTTGYAKLGLSAEYGMVWLLEQIVGHANTLELLLSSRKVKGEEVRTLGLANFVYPREEVMQRARDYAREMATLCSPMALAYIKNQAIHAPMRTLAEDVRFANQAMLVTNDSDDFREGQRAFMEKRAPKFAPWREPE